MNVGPGRTTASQHRCYVRAVQGNSTGFPALPDAAPGAPVVSRPAATPATWRSLLADAVGDLPERLLLVLMWVCVVVGVSTVAGQHRRALVVPLAVVVVAATWRLRPQALPRSRGDAVAVVVGLVLLTTWVLVQLPHTGERVLVTRDPDLYTLSSLWLVDHRGPSLPVPEGSEDSLGFDLRRGALQPQGAHLVPALSAVVGWGAGTAGVLAANLLWGAAGLLAVFALGRRLVGARWALLPCAALALSQPMVAFSRSMYSEPLALALSMLAGCLLLATWQSGRARDAVLCGVALGTVTLTRVDGLLVAVGVVAALSLVAVVSGSGAAVGRRWGSPLVAVGCLPLAALSVLDLYLYTGVYFDNSLASIALASGAMLTATAGSIGVALAAGPGGLLARRLPAPGPRWGRVGAVGLLLLWGVLWSRRWWWEGSGDDNAIVTALQELEGAAQNGGRTYSELTLSWASWYVGPLTVGVGLAGLAWWWHAGLGRRRQVPLLLVLSMVLPTTLLYLASPQITPDQVWAMRRFLPVVLPGLLLATAWVLRELVVSDRLSRGPAAGAAVLLGVLVVAWPASTLRGVWSVQDKGGALAGVQEVCDAVRGRPTVVSGVDTLLPTVAVVCRVPVYGVSSASPERLAEARRALGGGEVALVTRDTAGLADEAVVVAVEVRYTQWEARLLGRPRGGEVATTVISVGAVGAAGDVTAG